MILKTCIITVCVIASFILTVFLLAAIRVLRGTGRSGQNEKVKMAENTLAVLRDSNGVKKIIT